MTVSTIVSFGDSLTEADENSVNAAISEGGTGGWPELCSEMLGNLAGIGPKISEGARGEWINAAAVGAPEWTQAGSWTAVTSSDAWDKLPYGQGEYSAAGITAMKTWTKPRRWRTTLHGVAVYFVDYANGDVWSYSTDGGTTWTNCPAVSKDNRLAKFYVTGNIASFMYRAANAAGTAKGCFPAFIEPFYLAPSTATGVIWHNLAVNGALLHTTVAATSGDRLAFLDSVHALDGTVISNQPNVGILMMHGRDVILNNTGTWNTDMGTLCTRAQPLTTVLFMNHFELAKFPDETNSITPGFPWDVQTSYRDQLKTTAAAKSPVVQVFDQYDRYSKMGFGIASGTTVTITNSQNVALRAQGILNPLDNGHQLAAGHKDQATAVYWFLRNNLFSVGNAPSSYVATAKQAAVAYAGKQATVAYSAAAPLAVVPV